MTDDKKPNAVDPIETDGQVEHSFDFQPIEYHEWRQEGNMISCSSCPHAHGTPVAQGMVLRKDNKGQFTLIKEY